MEVGASAKAVSNSIELVGELSNGTEPVASKVKELEPTKKTAEIGEEEERRK